MMSEAAASLGNNTNLLDDDVVVEHQQEAVTTKYVTNRAFSVEQLLTVFYSDSNLFNPLATLRSMLATRDCKPIRLSTFFPSFWIPSN